jgi:hypothetical protein
VEAAKSVVESAAVEAAKSVVKSATVETATVETATVETATVETAAMRPGGGGIWLAERGSAQESSCGCQNPCHPGPGSRFV